MYYSTIHSYEWIVLFCAVILGRYYTDYHDVDEEIVTIVPQGGQWDYENSVGVMCRDICDSLSHVTYHVASSNMKNSQIIRIGIMPTKI